MKCLRYGDLSGLAAGAAVDRVVSAARTADRRPRANGADPAGGGRYPRRAGRVHLLGGRYARSASGSKCSEDRVGRGVQ